MPEFIKGMVLCEGFFQEAVRPVLSAALPGLKYSAGLLGYGSDVLGYDDETSADHLWGPRVYIFLRPGDMGLEGAIREALSAGLPSEYRGYSTHFGAPGLIRSMQPLAPGEKLEPLVWITTWDAFVRGEFGIGARRLAALARMGRGAAGQGKGAAATHCTAGIGRDAPGEHRMSELGEGAPDERRMSGFGGGAPDEPRMSGLGGGAPNDRRISGQGGGVPDEPRTLRPSSALPDARYASDWLSLSEHKLLTLRRGRFFHDGLGLEAGRAAVGFYPEDVRLYLMASQWSLIAEEAAFVKRCAVRGDDAGSRLVCARMAERLMRLCFLYAGEYAPYSKWFGMGFAGLEIPGEVKELIYEALSAGEGFAPEGKAREAASGIPGDTGAGNPPMARELAIVRAQAAVARLHNERMAHMTGLPVSDAIGKYFDRDILVIDSGAIVEGLCGALEGTPMAGLPLIGALCEVANFTALTEHPQYRPRIAGLYR